MEAGARVWIYDNKSDDAWVLAEITSRSETTLEAFQVSKPSNKYSRPRIKDKNNGDGDEVIELKYEGVELANTPLSEEEKGEGKDNDMITLPHLHEPAILHAIGERFDQGKIYTWTGPVLIAVNPFQRLPLYTSEILETYRRDGLLRSQGMGESTGTKLGPHVYAIADLSYRQMMAPERKSQSVLISGESGAGKTESTKIVMLYLTTLGTAHVGDEGKTEKDGDLSIMTKVLQSNPILEAFGNAKTLRNDNSSRFGKFIELGFSRSGTLLGAKITTYLLEKVRIGFHASGERSYHIFYQLLRGASDEQKKRYNFHDGDTHGIELVNYFHYTGQGGAPSLREFTDEDGLQYTLKAMQSLGWDEAKIDKVLSLVAGMLHLGQVNFDSVENEAGQEIAVIAEPQILANAASLLGVNEDKLKAALLERILVTRGESITIQLAPEKALDSRDALTKTMYGALFLWVVSEVNQSVIWANESEVRSSTGVLDIFGFECFSINSFEQLCINFTNEALQQQFNKFIFKMEQAEYERESIQWDFISFPDNQDCLDTIQGKKTGILAMLDDECRLGARGNDKNWADRLYKQFIPNKNQVESENTRFSATAIEKGKSMFTVRHFAGPVKYTATTSFLEKNKDEIPVTAQNLFDSADSWLIKDIYEVQKQESQEHSSSDKAGKPAKSKTVGQQFKQQLIQLMEKVESTEPHYIRCLKPNDAAKANLMTRRRLTEQLRYGGVLEAVRVARMGFPVRMNHELFYQTYRVLLPTVGDDKLPWSLESNDAQRLCISLVDMLLEKGKKGREIGKLSPSEEGISRSERIRRMQMQPIPMIFPKSDVQLGKTKVFLRKPAHDALEAHKVFHQTAAATILQAWIRGLQKRVRHLILCEAALTAQRFYRGCKGRQRWWRLREAVAGDLLTRNFRMFLVSNRYITAKTGTILLQSIYRGYATRRVLATIKIQSQYRMRRSHYAYRRIKSATISLQCRQRCGMAKKELAGLKHEQKDIGKLKQNNEKLKGEMASLKAMLAAQAKGSANKKESERELKEKEEEIASLEKRIRQLEFEIEKEKSIVKKLEESLHSERTKVQKQMDEITVLTEQNQNFLMKPPSSPQKALMPSRPPRTPSRNNSNQTVQMSPGISPELSPFNGVVDSKALTEQRRLVARLERELEKERSARRETDGEVIKLRAQINGVQLNEDEVKALLPTDDEIKSSIIMPNLSVDSMKIEAQSTSDTVDSEIRPIEPRTVDGQMIEAFGTPTRGEQKATIVSIPGKSPDMKDDMKELKNAFMSPTEFLPMIRRGFQNMMEDEDKDDIVSVGWNVEVTSRKEREETLRDEAHQFEVKLRKFATTLEHGIEVTMWQLNRNSEFVNESKDDFTLKSTQIQLKLQRRGEFLVQGALAFNMKGGYLSKAINRRKVDKAALEPLSLTEILEVSAGCDGYNLAKLPGTSKRSKKSDENKSSALFLTLKASPTPVASSRSYFLKFKSRSARNDLLLGLRSLLADMQIHEGVNISTMETTETHGQRVSNSPSRRRPGQEHHSPQRGIAPSDAENMLVPLSQVHKAIDLERQAYDRLLLLTLQGMSDLKKSEDTTVKISSTLDAVTADSEEKDRVQANDSQLIMQLSKKLETLLMDNEDLRDQNDTLNNRIIMMQGDKTKQAHHFRQFI